MVKMKIKQPHLYFLGFQTALFMIGNIFWKPFSSYIDLIAFGRISTFLILVIALICFTGGFLSKRPQLLSGLNNHIPKSPSAIFTFFGFLTGLIIASIVSIFGAFNTQLYNSFGSLGMVLRQSFWLWVMIGLTCLEIIAVCICQSQRTLVINWTTGKWHILKALSITIAAVAITGFVAAILLKVSFVRLIVAFYLGILLLAMGLLWLWGYLGIKYSKNDSWEKIQPYLKLLFIFLISFVLLHLTALLVNNLVTPSKAYFDELARAFLNGKLYLENPSSIHDLTFFNGQWYLPFPPLAALMMIPLVKIFGDVGFSTVTFTIFFASVDSALVYELLRKMDSKGWIGLQANHLIWLVISFVFGTTFWYMSIVGKVWYIERIVALTFMLLAVVLLINNRSPILVGITIGLSLWSRPNGIFLWPLFLGIYWQLLKDKEKPTIKVIAKWILLNAIPITIAITALLYYNWVRFGDWFDFGYQNQNVGENAANVVSEGFFNLKVIPRNLYRMLIALPVVQKSCKYIFVPNHLGMSIFFTSPAFIYIFKAFKKNIFNLALWVALILETMLLLLQNGITWEFGYSYILDIIIPILILVAIGAGKKVSWFMQTLIFLGIAVNFWGILWYFGYYCPVL